MVEVHGIQSLRGHSEDLITALRVSGAEGSRAAPEGIFADATRFDAWLRTGLDSAGRRGRLERSWHEPLPDFPLTPGQPPYLKVRALTLN